MPGESLDDVMQKLMHSRTHMALVLDEFGGITGVITLEGIIETIVGSIQDEFDFEEEHAKILSHRPLPARRKGAR